jgi:hypothetical protein
VGQEKKSAKVAPKIEPLPGYLLAQEIKCGKPNCKCSRGFLHGPYFYRVWNVGGLRYKEYVRNSDLAAVMEGINEYRKQKAIARATNEAARSQWRKLREKLDQLLALLDSVRE